LALEYQGEQHYFPSYFWMNLSTQKKNDKMKRILCERAGWNFRIIDILLDFISNKMTVVFPFRYYIGRNSLLVGQEFSQFEGHFA
jgi:hypothetical protein